MLPMLKEYFEGKALREISAQSVEKFKNDRMHTPTKKGTARRPATVNRELTLLSSAYSLAVKYDKAESNPCSKVDLFTLDNLRYRFLLPEAGKDLWDFPGGEVTLLPNLAITSLNYFR
jgi:hypothetical protein